MINEIMDNENLIFTLETSLRQTRNARNRLMSRLNEIEGIAKCDEYINEAGKLNSEITELEKSAGKIESAIYSLLSTMKSQN